MSVLLEKNGTTTAEVTMINARGILLFVGGKEYYLSYDRYPWFRIKPLLLYIDKEDRDVLIADKNKGFSNQVAELIAKYTKGGTKT